MSRSDTIADRIRALFGADCVASGSPGQPVIVTPPDEASIALLMHAASAERWRVRIAGTGGWAPADQPADITVSTNKLDRVTHVVPRDLVATVQAGAEWHDFEKQLAESDVWVAADVPGSGRSVGSVVATGTSGPLRGGFGGIRNHVLGLTIVTPNGRVIRPGGQVVKNVAGFDLTKLAVGSFGICGAITSVTFRLRSAPRADLTLIASGQRDVLLEAAQRMVAAAMTPAAMELVSPLSGGPPEWSLALRLVGSDAEVSAAHAAASELAGLTLAKLAAGDAARLWNRIAQEATAHTTTLRIGCLPSQLGRSLDLVSNRLSGGFLSVSVVAGSIRWSGPATIDGLRSLRQGAAQQEMPVTVERAPWTTLQATGHFGAYRQGVARLVRSIRQRFDPEGILVVPAGETQ